MAVKARLTEKILTLKAPAAGVHVLWRAPVACRVKAVRAYRIAGTGAVINAAKNGVDLCSADLSVTTASTWMSGVLAAPAVLKFAAGDTLTAEVVSVAGTPTDLVIQVDVEQDANT
ncbi:hypothetical protein [Streptosporangium sp. OZ121]|uniref:hypothetical protein n=1 Tax=Streptosporangium sp. OZ121 TaxID=3444183 RepID=UPI003F79BFA6